MLTINTILGIIVLISIPFFLKMRKKKREKLEELRATQKEIESKWQKIFGEDGLLENWYRSK